MQPLFYFPSTLIGVDDNLQNLSSLEDIFYTMHKIKTFSSPEEAVIFFKNYISPLSQFPFFSPLEDQTHDLDDHFQVDLNLSKIFQLEKIREKINEISVWIIDYSMPFMDGLTLCRLLKNIPSKIILLTGEKNGMDVTEAFNERIIDNYIRKDSPTLVDSLKQSVAALSREYFAEKTSALLAHLETEGKTPLSDKVFENFFNAWCNKNDIREYYLVERTGCFLCIDSKNNRRHFITHTDKSLENIQEHYSNLNIEISDFIKTKEKIPFFGEEKYFLSEDSTDIKNYFYPAKILEGREKYYWAVI